MPGLVELVDIIMLSIIDVSLSVWIYHSGFFLSKVNLFAKQTLDMNIVNVNLSVLRLAILNLHV